MIDYPGPEKPGIYGAKLKIFLTPPNSTQLCGDAEEASLTLGQLMQH